MKFQLGQTVATPGAQALLQHLHPTFETYLDRHAAGDWGDLDDEDKAANDQAFASGGRLLSAYETPLGLLWIITEADRSVTTLLQPSEY